jgi:hypothetical protein
MEEGMTLTALCSSCQRWEVIFVGTVFNPFVVEPSHCYGAADVPVPPDTFGGFRCSCPCRGWEKPDGS